MKKSLVYLALTLKLWSLAAWLYYSPPNLLIGHPLTLYGLVLFAAGLSAAGIGLVPLITSGKNIFSKWKIFSLFIVLVILWILFPPDITKPYYPPAPTNKLTPLKSIIPFPIGLPEVNASCPYSCLIDVCTRWIPGPSPQCPNPGSGGGCCTRYEQECDPQCEDPDPPPPAAPPSINGTVTCSQWGNNGWCRSTAKLTLIASDPQGYALTISGNADSSFTCAGSCTINLPMGSGTATYTVTAAQSGKSASGSASWKYDSQLPTPNLAISGTEGLNNWYVSSVNITGTGSDSLSGLASISLSVDGTPVSTSEVLNEGVHEIVVRAVDVAGNTASITRNISVDTTKPILDLYVNGTSGLNEWFVSPVSVTAFASDDTSGIYSTEYRIDGDEWRDGETTSLDADGEHIVNIRSMDNAGNTAGGSLSFKIDLTSPSSSFTSPPTTSPVMGDVQIQGGSQDETSGLSTVEISFDDYTWLPMPIADGQWSSPWDTTQMPNGTYSIFVRSTDQAGNREDPIRMNLVVGNPAPHVDIPFSWMISDPLPINIRAGLIPLAGAQLVIHDPQGRWPARRYAFEPGKIPTLFLWDRRFRDETLAVPGRYRVVVEAWDRFGNTGEDSGTIIIEDGPTSTITLTPTRTITPSKTPSPTLRPTKTTTSLPVTSTQGPLKPREQISLPKLTSAVVWPAVGFLGLFASFASVSLSDPRPKSLKRMSKTITRIIDQENITPWKG
jgi:hypothetical protein